MNIYTRKQRWKLILLTLAALIGISSLWYTNKLARELAAEERKKAELWAEAIKHISNVSTDAGDLSFALSVLSNNTTIPMILADEKNQVNSFRNLDSVKAVNDPKYLQHQIEIMKTEHEPIVIHYGDGDQKNFIYYKDSYLLIQLRRYPFFQLGVIALFLLVSYFAFSSSRRAEQDRKSVV